MDKVKPIASKVLDENHAQEKSNINSTVTIDDDYRLEYRNEYLWLSACGASKKKKRRQSNDVLPGRNLMLCQ